MRLNDSKYFNQIIFSLLERPKRKIDIMLDIFPYEVTFRKKVLRNKFEFTCSICHSNFSFNKRWGRPQNYYCPKCKDKLERGLSIPNIKDKNFKIGWLSNTGHFFNSLRNEKLIIDNGRKNPVDINFDTITETIITQILENTKQMSADSEINAIKILEKRLKNYIKNEVIRKNLFSFEKWKFLLFNERKFNPQFKTYLGFLNVCFLIYLLKYREKNLQKIEFKNNSEQTLYSTRLKIFKEKLVNIIIENRLESLNLNSKILTSNEYKKSKQIRQIIKEGFEKLDFDHDENLIEVLSNIYAVYFNFDVDIPISMITSEKFFDYIERGIDTYTFRKVKTLVDLFRYDMKSKIDYLLKM